MVEKNNSKKNPKIPLPFSQYGEDDVSIFFLLSCNLITGELTCGNHVTHY